MPVQQRVGLGVKVGDLLPTCTQSQRSELVLYGVCHRRSCESVSLYHKNTLTLRKEGLLEPDFPGNLS